jgi:hypothetical protein
MKRPVSLGQRLESWWWLALRSSGVRSVILDRGISDEATVVGREFVRRGGSEPPVHSRQRVYQSRPMIRTLTREVRR